MLPVLALVVLTGVVCSEGENDEIGSETESVFEEGSFGERPIGFPKHAKSSGGEGFDVIALTKEICEDGGIAIAFTIFGPGSGGNGITQNGYFERGGREGESGEEKDEERSHEMMVYVDRGEVLNMRA